MPSVVSFVSQQNGESFVAYTGSNAMGSIERLLMGKHTADSKFETREAQNTSSHGHSASPV